MRALGAFTLIELVVVVGIILILIGLGVPGYQMAIDRAKSTGCASNLHSLGAALDTYALDHNQCLPFGYYDSDEGAVVWTTLLIPYLESSSHYYTVNSTLYCPSTSVDGTGIYKRDNATWATDYTCNAYALKTFNESHPVHPFDCVASTILLYDGCAAGLPGGDEVEYRRHLNGLNCLFGDGHVEHLASLPEDADSWQVPPP